MDEEDSEDVAAANGDSVEIDLAEHESQTLLPEEYHTERQECLVVVSVDETRAAAVCCFRNDKDVEFFVEEIPACCMEASQEKAS